MADSMESLILQKLEKYGDTFVEGKIKKKRKNDEKEDCSETKKIKSDMMVSTSVTTSSTTLSRRQKKRMKKKKKEEPKEKNNKKDSVSAPKLSGPERSLKEMSERLGLEEFKKEKDRKMHEKKQELREKKKNKPEVVVFKSHKPKKKVQVQSKRKERPIFDLDSARFEVRKFGMKGLEGTEKKEAMTALLVKLGAKPPKNKFVSIKEYMKNRPKQLLEEKEKKEMDRRLGNKVTKANRESKRSRDKEDIGFIDGQIGFWKNGVQVVTKDDLKRSGLKMAKSK